MGEPAPFACRVHGALAFWASEAEEASHLGTGDPLLKLAVQGSGRQN